MLTKNKYVLCDIPNTLFNSIYRTSEVGCYLLGIEKDTLNYSTYKLLKMFNSQGYQIVLTHYVLNRLRPKVVNLLKSHKLLTEATLVTNFTTQDVYDNQTLKKHLYKVLMIEDREIAFVIDNEEAMKSYWYQQDVSLIQVPLF